MGCYFVMPFHDTSHRLHTAWHTKVRKYARRRRLSCCAREGARSRSFELVEEGRYGRDVLTVGDQLASELDASLGTQLPLEVWSEHFLALGTVPDAHSNGVGRALGWEDGRSQEHDRQPHHGTSAHSCKQDGRSSKIALLSLDLGKCYVQFLQSPLRILGSPNNLQVSASGQIWNTFKAEKSVCFSRNV